MFVSICEDAEEECGDGVGRTTDFQNHSFFERGNDREMSPRGITRGRDETRGEVSPSPPCHTLLCIPVRTIEWYMSRCGGGVLFRWEEGVVGERQCQVTTEDEKGGGSVAKIRNQLFSKDKLND